MIMLNCPDWIQICVSPALVSGVAGITGVCPHADLLTALDGRFVHLRTIYSNALFLNGFSLTLFWEPSHVICEHILKQCQLALLSHR